MRLNSLPIWQVGDDASQRAGRASGPGPSHLSPPLPLGALAALGESQESEGADREREAEENWGR
jgi:hypothetical protein